MNYRWLVTSVSKRLVTGEWSFDSVKTPDTNHHFIREEFSMERYKILLIFFFLLITFAIPAHSKVEIKEDWLYVDGVKFLIRGVGYSPFRTVLDYEEVPNSLMEEDFRRIKEAGFNTIMTWDVIPKRVLELANSYGLKVIMGIWLLPSADCNSQDFLDSSMQKVTDAIVQTRDYDNIILYTLAGEPSPEQLFKAGLGNVTAFSKKMVDAAHTEALDKPVSMTNWVKSGWLDMSPFDISGYNLYGHDFDDTRADIGISGYISWLKSIPGNQNKPFLVTEFGYSVSPKGEGNFGYGGNTLAQQAEGNVRLYREIVQSGAIGACVFEWNDEWWKAGEPMEHNPSAEEWFGIIGIEDLNEPVGKPRPAYHALQEALKVVVVNPKNMSRVIGNLNFEVSALPSITMVEYRIGNSNWISLKKDGNWWKGEWDSKNARDGEKVVQIRGLEAEKSTEPQTFYVWTYNKKPISLEPMQIEVTTDKNSYNLGDTGIIKVNLTGADGKPIANHIVNIAFERPDTWNLEHWKGTTDRKGILIKEVQLISKLAGYHLIFVVTKYKKGNFEKRYAKVLQLWLQ